jgi:hypothetical protein
MAIINQICNGCNGGKRSLNHRRFMGFEGYIWISLYYNCLTKTNHFFLRRFAPQLWSHIFYTDSGNWKFRGTVQNLDVLHAFPPWVEVAKGPVAIAGTSVWISTSSAGTWYRLIQDLPGRKIPVFVEIEYFELQQHFLCSATRLVLYAQLRLSVFKEQFPWTHCLTIWIFYARGCWYQ